MLVNALLLLYLYVVACSGLIRYIWNISISVNKTDYVFVCMGVSLSMYMSECGYVCGVFEHA